MNDKLSQIVFIFSCIMKKRKREGFSGIDILRVVLDLVVYQVLHCSGAFEIVKPLVFANHELRDTYKRTLSLMLVYRLYDDNYKRRMSVYPRRIFDGEYLKKGDPRRLCIRSSITSAHKLYLHRYHFLLCIVLLISPDLYFQRLCRLRSIVDSPICVSIELIAFSKLKTLEKISIHHAKLLNGLEDLAHVPQVKRIYVTDKDVTPHIFPALPNLEKLLLYKPYAMHSDMNNLALCKNLRSLTLFGSWNIPNLSQLLRLEVFRYFPTRGTFPCKIYLPSSVKRVAAMSMDILQMFAPGNTNTISEIALYGLHPKQACKLPFSIRKLTVCVDSDEKFSFHVETVIPQHLQVHIAASTANVDYRLLKGVVKFTVVMPGLTHTECYKKIKTILLPTSVRMLRLKISTDNVMRVTKLIQIRYPSVDIVCTEK
jgi:hypothetical protein